MWRSLAIGVALTGVLAGCSWSGGAGGSGGLPHRVVVPAGRMRQFTYADLFGHTVACANGGEWKVTRTPKAFRTPQMRVQFIGDGYVNVFCR